MSLLEFTHHICKTDDVINKELIENFERHFAMYSFTKIKNMNNIDLSEDNEFYIFKGDNNECDDIISKLKSFRCSHFHNTLIPVYTMIEEGLKIEFITDGVC